MADVAKMPASVPAGPSGALAGEDGVDRPGDEIRDAEAEGKTSRSVATAGRTGTAAAAAGDGQGARGEEANAGEDDVDARAANGARGGDANPEGAPSASADPPASGDADRPGSEEREDDQNEEDADDRDDAASDHDDETPLISPGGGENEDGDGGGVGGGPPVRRRSMRSAANITQEELSSCFHLPSEAACRRLGIGLTVLKRQCRKFGIKRWPFRKMKSLDRLITNVQAGISPGDQNRTLVKSVAELEEQKQRMQECHELDLDDDTKRLQQAYSKANHKARRAAHQTDMGGVGGLLALSGGAEGGLGGLNATAAAGLLSGGRPIGGGEKTIAEVLEAAKAQAELLRGVASTIPALLPGGAGSTASMAAAVAAAAAAMSAKSGAAVSAAAVSALMNASARSSAGGLNADPYAPSNSDAGDEADARDARNPTDAVVGAWSPARPVKPLREKGERGDARLDELLSASGRERDGNAEHKKAENDDDEWDDDVARESRGAAAASTRAGEARAKRERPPGWVETRGRPRKHPRRFEEAFSGSGGSPKEGEGDDPLASLAAAALAVKGRGRGRPPGSKNGSGKNAAALALRGALGSPAGGAPGGVSAVRKSTVTLLVTEHADRVREALNRTIDSLTGVDAVNREALARGVNEAVGVESLKLRDALNAALGAS
jgi:hypothetical protein